MGRPASPGPGSSTPCGRPPNPPAPTGLPIVAGRVDLDLTLARHEVTLVEITPVVDETPPWWDDQRLLGLWTGSRP